MIAPHFAATNRPRAAELIERAAVNLAEIQRARRLLVADPLAPAWYDEAFGDLAARRAGLGARIAELRTTLEEIRQELLSMGLTQADVARIWHTGR